MRYLVWSFIIICAGMLAGCARFPTTEAQLTVPAQTIYSSITVQSSAINPADYYFLAFGVDQSGATGPMPVATGFGYSNAWGTIGNLPGTTVQVPPLYVECHNDTFAEYVIPPGQTQPQYLGVPYSCGINGNTLYVEIDQKPLTQYNLVGTTTSPIVQVNWITLENLDPPPDGITIKQYDGFGPSGNDYLDKVPLNTAQTWESGVGGVPSQPGFENGEITTSGYRYFYQ